LKLGENRLVDAFVDEIRTNVVDDIGDDVEVEAGEVDSHGGRKEGVSFGQ
jgi:hypothetical protein